MSRGWKLALGAATAWPALYLLANLIFIVVMLLLLPSNGSAPPEQQPVDGLLAGLHRLDLFTVLDMLVLTVVYIILVIRMVPSSDSMRVSWLLAVTLGSFIGQAVFFALKVWPRRTPIEPAHA